MNWYPKKQGSKILGYLTPTNAIISENEYQFLSTAQQNQCTQIHNLEDLERKTKLNSVHHRRNIFKTKGNFVKD